MGEQVTTLNVMRLLNRVAPPMIALGWLLLVMVGLRWLTLYANEPGDPGQPLTRLEAASTDQHTLVMFLHPQCPCSRASVEELAVLISRCEQSVSAKVVFCQPGGFDQDWVKSDLWSSAARIPGVETVIDAGCEETRRFGAATSGQVLLYDPLGHLVFQGGITAARGHIGDNAGRASVLRLIGQSADCCEENRREREQVPVFGCPLVE